MIIGNINNLGTEKEYPAVILEALNHLKNTDWSKKENGKYEIKGKDMFVILSEYETAPAEDKKPEVHKKYIDIQYLFSGEEIIKAVNDSGKNKIFSDYSEANDIMFYESAENESEILMVPGVFAVFYPHDVHKPGCTNKTKSKIHKAVIKISVDL